jgi:hypothetical protein
MIPFGIWGGIAFVWFIAAALRVLYLNYRFGDTNLKTYNVLLFAAFISRTLVFFTIGGGIQSDMAVFAGLVGLSVALNGGVRRSAPVVASEAEQAEIATGLLQRPAFQR